jgi:hypothetical protein
MKKEIIYRSIGMGIISLCFFCVPKAIAATTCEWKTVSGQVQFCASGLTEKDVISSLTITCTNGNCPYVGTTVLKMAAKEKNSMNDTFTSCTALDADTKEKISRQVNLDHSVCEPPNSPLCEKIYTDEQPQIKGDIGICSKETLVTVSAESSITLPGQQPSDPVFTPEPEVTQPPKDNGGKTGASGTTGAGGSVGASNPYCKGGETINTAIGCIDVSDTTKLFNTVFTLFLGVAGGIGLLVILMGALKVTMSGGNPKVLGEGQELITSAIVGLLMVLFSVFLLRIIGLDILGIPGFS